MSKLQELIRELCPEGVEYKTIQETVGVNRGKRLTKRQLSDDGKYDVYHGSKDSILGKYIDYNAPGNTVIIINTGGIGGVKFLDKPFWCSDGSFWLGQSNYVNSKYLYYYLAGYEDYFYSQRRVGGVPTIDRSVVEKFEIPVPPLEVQEEIVRILDHFTNLAAELQAELQARKEQYEYYRNKLLTFDKIGEGAQSVTWMKMSEIGTFIRGKRFVRTDIVSDGVPCIHYGDMYTYYGLYTTQSKGRLRSELASKMRYAQKNDVVIVAAGENKEDIGIGLAWIGDEPAAVHDACFIFRSDLYPQYVSHYLRSDYYHKQIVKYVSEGKICSISAKGLGNTIIPVPPYEEQVRIATLLNNFDALVGDLTEGLPAEMAAVQEQYEYYRNKLLSFPRIQISA